MKKTSLTLFLIFLGLKVFSQNQDVYFFSDSTENEKRYIAWISPSNATHVYGLMFNFWDREDVGYSSHDYPKIYGIEFNIMPLSIFYPGMLAVNSIAPETHQPPKDSLASIKFDSFKKIYGLQIGLMNLEPTIINGLDINVGGSSKAKTNGITISAVMNYHYVMNGLTIAVIGNNDIKCNGVQIGLINTCRLLNGFQFGLWNKNQRRSLPFINWCFKTKKGSTN